jgi:hypothetical protein
MERHVIKSNYVLIAMMCASSMSLCMEGQLAKKPDDGMRKVTSWKQIKPLVGLIVVYKAAGVTRGYSLEDKDVRFGWIPNQPAVHFCPDGICPLPCFPGHTSCSGHSQPEAADDACSSIVAWMSQLFTQEQDDKRTGYEIKNLLTAQDAPKGSAHLTTALIEKYGLMLRRATRGELVQIKAALCVGTAKLEHTSKEYACSLIDRLMSINNKR